MKQENVIISYLGVTGLMASHAKDRTAADKITAGLDATGCELPSVQMALAMIDLNCGRYDQAEDRLRAKVLANDPDHFRAKIILGLVEQGRGFTARRDALWQEVIDAGVDAELAELIEKERAA